VADVEKRVDRPKTGAQPRCMDEVEARAISSRAMQCS
jgi:hypothetical protein